MKIRKAQETDIPRIGDLLSQVLEVHHQGRPDIFKTGVKKYTDDQLFAYYTEKRKARKRIALLSFS